MRKGLWALAGTVLLMAAACGSSGNGNTNGSGSGPLKVAFILDGPINDGGFNQGIYNGIQQLQQHFGSKVQATYKQNIPENPQSAQVIDSLIQGGNTVIFATSYGYHTFVAKAAKANPDVKFMQYESTELAPNLSEYYFGIDQSWYLAGMTAGAATKSGHMGMVASFPIPALLIQVNAFELGAQSVNPQATTRVIWLSSWYDPAKATQAAKSLVASGVDTLANTMDDASVVQVAEQNNVPVVGHDLDQEKFAPNSWLTGAMFVNGPYFIREVGDALNGSWKSENFFGELKDGVTALAPFGKAYQTDVPSDVKSQLQQKLSALKQGTFDDFTGPISDQNGKVQVPAGHVMTATEKEQMNFLVQGVLGTLNT
ncbi:MAG TPA: BMP family ABC transporter substrate-binding protein [Actinomycetota bacterium]|jgi:basic membrane lipoprotein Med (substrate-binding protein (PBP1-ABC) superfamily)